MGEVSDKPTCPNCQEVMEVGYLLGRAKAIKAAVEWVEGEFERSVWEGVKVSGRRTFSVEAYRCPSCGLVLSYAL